MENMTAVEWLIKQFTYEKNQEFFIRINQDDVNVTDDCNQAKQKELEQQEYFFNCGRQYQLTGECTFKQVLAETFKK